MVEDKKEGFIAWFFASDTRSYYFKAIGLGLLITVVGTTAPNMSSFDVLVVLVVYSTISLIGMLYYTMAKRAQRQYILERDGQFSRINRKWPVRTGVYFGVFFVSGLVFLLETPKWNPMEWWILWLALIAYYPVFVFIRRRFSKELTPRFSKAAAIRASFYIMGAVLCVVYAGITLAFPPESFDTLKDAFDSTSNRFDSANCALLCDVSWISTFTDGLAAYGLGRLTDNAPIIVVIICEFIVYAFVFFGLVNQLSACLLSVKEIKSEFQLLPANGEKQAEQPILKRYFVVIGVVAAVLIGAFLLADHYVAEARETEEHTWIEVTVTGWRQALINEFDDINKQTEERVQELEEEKQEWEEESNSKDYAHKQAIRRSVDEYYDKCIENIDAYINWFNNPFQGGIVRLGNSTFFSQDGQASIENFKNIVTEGTNAGVIEGLYRLDLEYQGKSNQEPIESILWATLSDANIDDLVQRILPKLGEPINGDELKAGLTELIEEARQHTYSELGIADESAE